MQTAKIVRLTADGQVLSGKQLVVGIQVIGGSAATALYDGTGVVAANKLAEVTGGTFEDFGCPISCPNGAYIDAGVGATEILVHVI